MSPEAIETLKFIGPILGAALASWGGVKATLNGTREDVREIKRDVKALSGSVAKVRERVAILEDRDERVST